MRRNKGQYRIWPFLISALLFLAAVALFIYNRLEDTGAGQQAEAVLIEFHEQVSVPEVYYPKNAEERLPVVSLPSGMDIEAYVPDYILNPDMEMPVIEIDGNLYIGSLCFPALDLELPVMSSWSYPNLRIAPCVYSGSVYSGNAVIAAHNYSSHFGRLSKLTPGSVVQFTDIDGNVFVYEVMVQEVLDSRAIEEMVSSGYDLSLFTCTKGGGARFTVRCSRFPDV